MLVNVDGLGKVDLRYDVDGCDALCDIFGSLGMELCFEDGVPMDGDEYSWWVTWVGNQEAIDAAYRAADERKRQEADDIVAIWSCEMEDSQNMLLECFGLC